MPTPRTVKEWTEILNPATIQAYTRAEAEQKIAEDVFGVGFQRDAKGNPIERGKGSAAQITQQHIEAQAKEDERRAMVNPAAAATNALAVALTGALAAKPKPAARAKRPARKAKPKAEPAPTQASA